MEHFLTLLLNRNIAIALIVVAFVMGTLVASTPVSGAKGGAIQEVWDAIFGLQTQIDDLEERLTSLEDPPEPPTPQPPGDADVIIPQGTSQPGCEETDECYIPFSITKSVGATITWKNDDSAAHTVTSGTPSNGPDGKFDSSLFMAGTSFAVQINEVGEYPYFCMVHPWMEGIVTISDEFFITVTEEQQVPGVGKVLTIRVFGAEGVVNIEIISEEGEIIEELSFPSSDEGEVVQPWIIPPGTEPGIYTFKAEDAFNTAETTFELI
jgi:plastocyanin